jgi:hypothetical protein
MRPYREEPTTLPSIFTLDKESFTLGKGFTKIALDKVRLTKFSSAKRLCRVFNLSSVSSGTRQISVVTTPAINGYFAECPARHSAIFLISF